MITDNTFKDDEKTCYNDDQCDIDYQDEYYRLKQENTRLKERIEQDIERILFLVDLLKDTTIE